MKKHDYCFINLFSTYHLIKKERDLFIIRYDLSSCYKKINLENLLLLFYFI